MEKTKVLYIVGEISPISIPLEVAGFIDHSQVQLNVTSFYKTFYSGSSFETEPVCMEAETRYDISAVYKLCRHIRRVKPDVVHVHHTVPSFWGSLLSKGIVSASLVRSEHNNYEHYTVGQRAVKTVSQGLANLVLFNSRSTYRSMEDWRKRLLGNRWRVVHNGVDFERIDRAASGNPPFTEQFGGVTVGSVGRLVTQKNYLRFIRSFAKVVNQSEQNVRFILVGDGNERNSIQTEIDRLDLNEHVMMTGEVDRDTVYAALHGFDLFVVPSLWEGFCNAAVEAMAAGLPILCSDIQTLHEVVGEAATYANPKAPEQMANVLLELIKQGPGEWKRQGENARERAQTRFTVQRTAEAYVESYLEVAHQ
jgi:glycosyltransferase involved in cell wall biosynthesis